MRSKKTAQKDFESGEIKMFMELIGEGSPALSTLSEELELVHRAQQGDTVAFAELVTKYQNKVFSRVFCMIQSEEDALEISQKTFIRAWQAIRDFQGKSSFYTWLYRVATRAAIEWLRCPLPRFVELNADLRAPRGDSESEIQRNEVRQIVLTAVAKLSPEQRAVVILKDVENLQYSEIAEILQCSIGTVMSRLFHARRRLQALLRPLYKSLP